MATITLHNIPEQLFNRIQTLAQHKGITIEEEIRDLLQIRYQQRHQVLARIRQRTASMPFVPKDQLKSWIEEGRL